MYFSGSEYQKSRYNLAPKYFTIGMVVETKND
jgi:hypothetical protein